MNAEAVFNTYMRDQYFTKRIITLVSTTPITIYELENLYMSTYNLESSQLIHCSNKQKAMVLSTIPGVHVRTIVSENDILGSARISLNWQKTELCYGPFQLSLLSFNCNHPDQCVHPWV